jgi:DNA-binding NarL/FixJ family response regulator
MTTPLNVYLVEDSPMLVERIQDLLASVEGVCAVGHAARADEAIREILKLRPHAVLCDLKLSAGSGFDVLRALHERAPSIDVYVLSNYTSEPYRRLAGRLGAREMFDKTSDFERVREMLAARARALH